MWGIDRWSPTYENLFIFKATVAAAAAAAAAQSIHRGSGAIRTGPKTRISGPDRHSHTHTHTHKAAVYRRTEAGARHRGQRNGERQKWIDTGGPRNRFRPGVVHKVDAGDAVSRMPASAAAAALIGAPASAQFRSRSGGRLCPANWIFMLPCRPRKVGFGKFTRIWKSLGFNWIF